MYDRNRLRRYSANSISDRMQILPPPDKSFFQRTSSGIWIGLFQLTLRDRLDVALTTDSGPRRYISSSVIQHQQRPRKWRLPCRIRKLSTGIALRCACTSQKGSCQCRTCCPDGISRAPSEANGVVKCCFGVRGLMIVNGTIMRYDLRYTLPVQTRGSGADSGDLVLCSAGCLAVTAGQIEHPRHPLDTLRSDPSDQIVDRNRCVVADVIFEMQITRGFVAGKMNDVRW